MVKHKRKCLICYFLLCAFSLYLYLLLNVLGLPPYEYEEGMENTEKGQMLIAKTMVEKYRHLQSGHSDGSIFVMASGPVFFDYLGVYLEDFPPVSLESLLLNADDLKSSVFTYLESMLPAEAIFLKRSVFRILLRHSKGEKREKIIRRLLTSISDERERELWRLMGTLILIEAKEYERESIRFICRYILERKSNPSILPFSRYLIPKGLIETLIDLNPHSSAFLYLLLNLHNICPYMPFSLPAVSEYLHKVFEQESEGSFLFSRRGFPTLCRRWKEYLESNYKNLAFEPLDRGGVKLVSTKRPNRAFVQDFEWIYALIQKGEQDGGREEKR